MKRGLITVDACVIASASLPFVAGRSHGVGPGGLVMAKQCMILGPTRPPGGNRRRRTRDAWLSFMSTTRGEFHDRKTVRREARDSRRLEHDPGPLPFLPGLRGRPSRRG